VMGNGMKGIRMNKWGYIWSGWYRRAAGDDPADGSGVPSQEPSAERVAKAVEWVEKKLDKAAERFMYKSKEDRITHADIFLWYLSDAEDIKTQLLHMYNNNNSDLVGKDELTKTLDAINRHVDRHYPGDHWIESMHHNFFPKRFMLQTNAPTLVQRWARIYTNSRGILPHQYISTIAQDMVDHWNSGFHSTIAYLTRHVYERGLLSDIRNLIEIYGDEVPQEFRDFYNLETRRDANVQRSLAPDAVERLRKFKAQMMHKYYWRDYHGHIEDGIDKTLKNGGWEQLYPLLTVWKDVHATYINGGGHPENKFPNNETYNRLEELYHMMNSSMSAFARGMLKKGPKIWESLYRNNRDLFRRAAIWVAVHYGYLDQEGVKNMTRIMDHVSGDVKDYIHYIFRPWGLVKH
jgi:hypothetical protein